MYMREIGEGNFGKVLLMKTKVMYFKVVFMHFALFRIFVV